MLISVFPSKIDVCTFYNMMYCRYPFVFSDVNTCFESSNLNRWSKAARTFS